MTKQGIDVRPIAGELGAQLHGVDLSQPLDASVIKEIESALFEHLVIVFRE